METNAQTHTQLIDSYFSERILETEALSRLEPIQWFLGGDGSEGAKARALASLSIGQMLSHPHCSISVKKYVSTGCNYPASDYR